MIKTGKGQLKRLFFMAFLPALILFIAMPVFADLDLMFEQTNDPCSEDRMNFNLQIHNTGSTSVAINTLSVRLWINSTTDPSYNAYGTGLINPDSWLGNISSATVTDMSSPCLEPDTASDRQANKYITITWSTTESLLPGQHLETSGDMPNGSVFDPDCDDYSTHLDGSGASAMDSYRYVALYVSGALEEEVESGGNTDPDTGVPPCSVPTPTPTSTVVGLINCAYDSNDEYDCALVEIIDQTPTFTPTFTFTLTNTPTPTYTPTSTYTDTSTPTPTFTNTLSPTPTFTVTFTPTDTATPTDTPTYTATTTITFTSTYTDTPTNTPTDTDTPTYTLTSTETPTDTFTITVSSDTPTDTPTETVTFTATPTDTATATITFTATSTDTSTPTPTITVTTSATFTPTATPTYTATPTFTNTSTPTPTSTDTPEHTNTNTPTFTPTDTDTPTYTVTNTVTFTFTRTLTATPTASYTDTPTSTITPSVTGTNTPTFTYTATPTVTWTLTVTPTRPPFPYIITMGMYNEAGELVREFTRESTSSSIEDVKIKVGGEEGVNVVSAGQEFDIELPGVETPHSIGKGGTTFTFEPSNDQGQNLKSGPYFIKIEQTDKYGHKDVFVDNMTVVDDEEYVELNVFNSAGELVRNIRDYSKTAVGQLKIGVEPDYVISADTGGKIDINFDEAGQIITWDCKTDDGRAVGTGAYEIQVVAKTGDRGVVMASKTVTLIYQQKEFLESAKFYPNPFISVGVETATIEWKFIDGITQSGIMNVYIYNMAGEMIRALDAELSAGSVEWDGRNSAGNRAAHGFYVCVLRGINAEGHVNGLSVKMAVIGDTTGELNNIQ